MLLAKLSRQATGRFADDFQVPNDGVHRLLVPKKNLARETLGIALDSLDAFQHVLDQESDGPTRHPEDPAR